MKIDEELWQAYSDPYFYLCHDVRDGCFAIITAWNPASIPLSYEDNHRKNDALEKELTEKHWTKVWVGNQDFSWKEASYAVAMEREMAVDLGKKFKQNAIYYVDRERLYLVSCLGDATVKEVGDFHSRCVKGI